MVPYFRVHNSEQNCREVIKREQKYYKSANVLYRKYSQSIKYTLLQKLNNCINVEVLQCIILKENPSVMKSKQKIQSTAYHLLTTIGSEYKFKESPGQHCGEQEPRGQGHILLLPDKVVQVGLKLTAVCIPCCEILIFDSTHVLKENRLLISSLLQPKKEKPQTLHI